MNLSKKKVLASKALGVGKNRIIFNPEGLSEIKEAITKQDIISLKDDGIISIKPVKGRTKVKRRKTRRGPGKIKKTVNKRKQIYVKITRKLRNYIKQLTDRGVIERDLYKELRKKIRMRAFKSKANLKEHLKSNEKVDFDRQSVSEYKIKNTKKKVVKKVEKTAEGKE
ncbi:hypothetical protein HOD75_04460 [archaeon]|jgi:large subunit ribosomal protein L19e|nr:hypothetical protein [archaeon]MBT4242117.1 hypothetical protein [archaeon]MBT4417805.1 hypothetical protein [archaeon]